MIILRIVQAIMTIMFSVTSVGQLRPFVVLRVLSFRRRAVGMHADKDRPESCQAAIWTKAPAAIEDASSNSL